MTFAMVTKKIEICFELKPTKIQAQSLLRSHVTKHLCINFSPLVSYHKLYANGFPCYPQNAQLIANAAI